MTQAFITCNYPVRVEPHLTDYAGVVWHGSYLRWLEEARIDALRQVGMEYADLVRLGCDLPVITLELNYRQALHMGHLGLVKSRILHRHKVRLTWEQNIYIIEADQSTPGTLAVEAKVTIVPVDMQKKRIMRRLPEALEQSLESLIQRNL